MIRRGGVSTTATGERVVWTIADGRRGRRWRESVTRDGALLRTVLFELDPSGRVGRLEVATATGLLTLHPDGDGRTLHGNVVSADGVRHLTFDWGPDRGMLVDGSPASSTIAAVSAVTRVLRIADDLEPHLERWDRAAGADLDAATASLIATDADDEATWPLELD
jgi:hypothetical protein